MEKVKRGILGKIKMIRSGFSFLFPEERFEKNYRGKKEYGGGALYDTGCYCVNITRFIMGEEPQKIIATSSLHQSFKIDTTTSAILEFSKGKYGILFSSFEMPSHQFCEISGTEGILILTLPFLPGRNSSEIILRKGNRSENIRIEYTDPYTAEVEHFSEGLCNL